jgi:SAM-dependent methyltransferase
MANVTQFPPDKATRAALDRWYRSSPNGARLRHQLEVELRERMEAMFGYHMVVLGVEGGMPISDWSRVQQVVTSSPFAPGNESGVPLHVIAEDEELPFETDSVDVVVALHTLDLSANPHQVLREIRRVLTPQGHLLIVGLNPHSLLGGWRRMHGWFRRSRWRDLAFLGVKKLEDWLTLLDFEIEPPRHKLPLPAVGEGRFAQRIRSIDDWLVRHNLPGGSVYLIQANKLVRGHIHGHAIRRERARLIPIPVSRPVAGKVDPSRRQNSPSNKPQPR